MLPVQTKKKRGRPVSVSAVAHERILDTVQAILEEKSFQDLTMEEVAQRAEVGKPTLYKWWPSKSALVLDLFQERLVRPLAVSESMLPAEKIRAQVQEAIWLLNGFFGKLAREIIAEGQADPETLRQYRNIYLAGRRGLTQGFLAEARDAGEAWADRDPELLIDLIYGPIYYRLLVGHQPLDAYFGNALVDSVLSFSAGRGEGQTTVSAGCGLLSDAGEGQ